MGYGVRMRALLPSTPQRWHCRHLINTMYMVEHGVRRASCTRAPSIVYPRKGEHQEQPMNHPHGLQPTHRCPRARTRQTFPHSRRRKPGLRVWSPVNDEHTLYDLDRPDAAAFQPFIIMLPTPWGHRRRPRPRAAAEATRPAARTKRCGGTRQQGKRTVSSRGEVCEMSRLTLAPPPPPLPLPHHCSFPPLFAPPRALCQHHTHPPVSGGS